MSSGYEHTNDLPLGNEQSQLVLACVGQLAQLDAANLRSDRGSKFLHVCLVLGKEIGEGWVRVFAVVIVLEGL